MRLKFHRIFVQEYKRDLGLGSGLILFKRMGLGRMSLRQCQDKTHSETSGHNSCDLKISKYVKTHQFYIIFI